MSGSEILCRSISSSRLVQPCDVSTKLPSRTIESTSILRLSSRASEVFRDNFIRTHSQRLKRFSPASSRNGMGNKRLNSPCRVSAATQVVSRYCWLGVGYVFVRISKSSVVNPRSLSRSHCNKWRIIAALTEKTGYELANSVCGLGESRHSCQPFK